MKTKNYNLQIGVIFGVFSYFFLLLVPAQADIKQIKAYKEAFADSKPKCLDCHIDEKPKKDDGQHETNDYGKAIIKAAGSEKPSADTYKAVGKIEDFKK